jgi:FkbM family methyltransferase
MREIIWLRLRNSWIAKSLYEIPGFARLMKIISYILLPSEYRGRLRVRSGPAAGLIFELNPRWEIQLWEGNYEADDQQIIQGKLKRGSIFYDVGAGFGFYSFLAARLGAKVYAFEPDVVNAEAIGRHANINSLGSNIEVCRSAVLARIGTVQFQLAPQNRGHGNGQVLDALEIEQKTITVQCTTLDEFARSNLPPDLIKIDVEGSESEVFKGAEKLFRQCRPDVICEIHDESNGSFVLEWLSRRNYSVNWIENRNKAKFPRHLVGTPIAPPTV